MPRMSWPSWRRIRTVTRAAGMATGAGGARHCWSRGAVSRRREARTGQPGAEQQGCRSARNSRGARPPGGRSWTVRQVLRLSSPVLGAATNAQGQGAVVARSEHLARRGSSWSAPGRDGRGARSTGTRSVAAQQGQAHGSGRCAAAGAARQDARRPGLARAERRLGGAGRARRGGWAPGGGRWGVAAWRLSLASRGRAPLGSCAPAATEGGGDGWGRRSSAGGRPGDRRLWRGGGSGAATERQGAGR